MPLILMLYLGLGAVTSIQGFSGITADAGTLSAVIGVHIALIGFALFAATMAKRQESGSFLGLSRTMWPVATGISYVVGLVGPFFVT